METGASIDVRALTADDRAWAEEALDAGLGSRLQVRRGELVDLLEADGLVAWRGGQPAGVLTWRRDGPDRIEISGLLALERGRGIGSALLAAVADLARSRGARAIRVTTTNDNLTALALYQRRGYRLAELRAGAVDEARRRLKPAIPEIAANGIPMRDELELELALG